MIYQTVIFPGQTIVKKNNLHVVKFGKFSSIRTKKVYDNYKKDALTMMAIGKKHAKFEYPVYAHYFFHRKDKRKFDLTNLCEGPQDMMQEALIIEDDDMNHLIPVFHGLYAGWALSKENPRCVITLTDENY